MTSIGIHRRLRRLQGPRARYFWLALDHGLPAGPLPGIEDPRRIIEGTRGTSITGVIANPGVARLLPPIPPRVLHLSAGTLLARRPTSKVLATTVGRALSMGADAVSVQVHFGDVAEDRMLAEAGTVADNAASLGLPLVLMAHPPRPPSTDAEAVRHAARAAAELGPSLVQVPLPDPPASLREVVAGCPVPVLVTGGPAAPSPDAFLETVHAAMSAGAAGVAVGRNLFGARDPGILAARIGLAIFGTAGRWEKEVPAR